MTNYNDYASEQLPVAEKTGEVCAPAEQPERARAEITELKEYGGFTAKTFNDYNSSDMDRNEPKEKDLFPLYIEKSPFLHKNEAFNIGKTSNSSGEISKILPLCESKTVYSTNIKERVIKRERSYDESVLNYKSRAKVFLCLGSDKLIFDCLGPLVGSLLKGDKRFDGYVYGTMSEPVTALQVEEAIRFIRRFHFGAEVTVVDSAIGKKEEIGTVKMFDRGLRPALGVDKEMRIVGDKSIMGIVTTKDKVKNLNTCNVKLNSVYSMAKRIAEIICSECANAQKQAQ